MGQSASRANSRRGLENGPRNKKRRRQVNTLDQGYPWPWPRMADQSSTDNARPGGPKGCHVRYLRGEVHSNPSSVPSSIITVSPPPNYSTLMSTNAFKSLRVRRSTRLNKALAGGLPCASGDLSETGASSVSTNKEKRIEGGLS
jgi:hypothetical protein